MCKFYADFENAKKIGKFFLVLEIMVFEPVVEIYLNYDDNTYDRQSSYYQTVLRLQI